MLEIAPGVYTAPSMTRGVRERVWSVLSDWHAEERIGSVLMTWPDSNASGEQAMMLLGEPAKDLYVLDGHILVRRELADSLKIE